MELGVPIQFICNDCMNRFAKPAEDAHLVAQREACLQCLQSSTTSDIYYAKQVARELKDIYDRLEYLGGNIDIDDDTSKELESILKQFDRVELEYLDPLLQKLNE